MYNKIAARIHTTPAFLSPSLSLSLSHTHTHTHTHTLTLYVLHSSRPFCFILPLLGDQVLDFSHVLPLLQITCLTFLHLKSWDDCSADFRRQVIEGVGWLWILEFHKLVKPYPWQPGRQLLSAILLLSSAADSSLLLPLFLFPLIV